MHNHLNLAVLGNPNKGKSSLVATLAYDDKIKVSSFSGETTVSQSFDLIINNKIVYKLYDTPGFDNEDELLNFIDDKELEGQSNKLKILEQFRAKYQFEEDYDKEIEIIKVLLKEPIIFFVVDSSKRYQKANDSQLEFIKWLNFPTIIIYNQISQDDYSQDWDTHISKYIDTSLKLNIFDIDLNKKILLLQKAMELDISKTQKDKLKKAIQVLEMDYSFRVDRSVDCMVNWIKKAVNFEKKFTIPKLKLENKNKDEYFLEFKEDYFEQLAEFEREYQKEVENIWGFSNLNFDMNKYNVSTYPLNSTQSIELFGVSENSIRLVGIGLGAVGGASFGSSIDFLGGMGLGTTIGGLLGAVTGVYTTTFIQEYVNIQTKSIGQQISLTLGPIKDINLILSIIVRAIVHIDEIKSRSHAKRDNLSIENLSNMGEQIFKNTSQRREILKLAQKLGNESKYFEEFKLIIKEKLEN